MTDKNPAKTPHKLYPAVDVAQKIFNHQLVAWAHGSTIL